MDQDILRIEDVEVVSRSDHPEDIELRITAIVGEMVQTVPAVLYPGIAEPAQYGSARCVATVTVSACLDDVQWEIAE